MLKERDALTHSLSLIGSADFVSESAVLREFHGNSLNAKNLSNQFERSQLAHDCNDEHRYSRNLQRHPTSPPTTFLQVWCVSIVTDAPLPWKTNCLANVIAIRFVKDVHLIKFKKRFTARYANACDSTKSPSNLNSSISLIISFSLFMKLNTCLISVLFFQRRFGMISWTRTLALDFSPLRKPSAHNHLTFLSLSRPSRWRFEEFEEDHPTVYASEVRIEIFFSRSGALPRGYYWSTASVLSFSHPLGSGRPTSNWVRTSYYASVEGCSFHDSWHNKTHI